VSWQATAWADSLDYDTLKSYLAYRVLIKLCNNADALGRTAWRSTSELAQELGVSQRSIHRALRELEQARLILPGDQDFVKHIRADRRPRVYDMNLGYREETATAEFDLDDGVTEISTGETRGDNYGLHGVTTVVAHRTIHELPTTKTSQSNHRAAVTPLVPPGYEPVPGYIPCNGPGPHQYPIGSDDETPCRRCGYIRYQLERDNREHQARREAQGP